jgi:CO/xanthine dehydrogenase Mo-binding subunit
MKGIGEVCANATYPAIANAVAQALGRRIFDGPITAERVLQALTAEHKEI